MIKWTPGQQGRILTALEIWCKRMGNYKLLPGCNFCEHSTKNTDRCVSCPFTVLRRDCVSVNAVTWQNVAYSIAHSEDGTIEQERLERIATKCATAIIDYLCILFALGTDKEVITDGEMDTSPTGVNP